MAHAPRIGVLALQGATAAHAEALGALGASTVEIRRPPDLEGVDGLVLPGGESTTLSLLLASSGLAEPLAERIAEDLPVFGTCAGMILLAREVLDGRSDQIGFGRLDITVRRNAFGRQLDSFEADLAVTGLEATFPAVFIRAPVVEASGPDVEILASVDGRPVLVRHRSVLAAAFHPELTDDPRLHALFLDQITPVRAEGHTSGGRGPAGRSRET